MVYAQDSQLENGAVRSPRQWQAYLEAQAQRGRIGRTLVAEIVADGYSPVEVEAWVSAASRSQMRKAVGILGGSALLLCLGLSTFVAATQARPGSTSYLWLGAVVCGAVGVVYGVSRLAKMR